MKEITQKEYQNRRKKLFSHMEDNSILVISGENEKVRNNDVNYEFRQGSDFWYLTGIEEPDALMILVKKDYRKVYFILSRKNN